MVSEVISFSSVEKQESAAQATGWQIEYRQLEPGRLNAWFTSSEVEGINLSVEEFDNRLQVCCEPPQVFFGIMLPRFKPGRAAAAGQNLKDGDLVVKHSCASKLEILTRGQIQNGNAVPAGGTVPRHRPGAGSRKAAVHARVGVHRKP